MGTKKFVARAGLFLALTLTLVLLLSIDPAFAELVFPTLAYCTGDSVRLRDAPGTNGTNVIGKVNRYDALVILDSDQLDGNAWYQVIHPTEDRRAWIIGSYVDFDSMAQQFDFPRARPIVTNVRIQYGTNPEKMRTLHGKPRKESREQYYFEPAASTYTNLTLEYSGFTATFTEGKLREIYATERGVSVGGVVVGEHIANYNDLLGRLECRELDDGSRYILGEVEDITIMYNEDGVITAIKWSRYLDA